MLKGIAPAAADGGWRIRTAESGFNFCIEHILAKFGASSCNHGSNPVQFRKILNRRKMPQPPETPCQRLEMPIGHLRDPHGLPAAPRRPPLHTQALLPQHDTTGRVVGARNCPIRANGRPSGPLPLGFPAVVTRFRRLTGRAPGAWNAMLFISSNAFVFSVYPSRDLARFQENLT